MKNICLFSFFLFSAIAYSQKDTPKIIVGIVVDQMCYDYLNRFNVNFSEQGFKKMIREGAHLTNMHYNYIPTYTGPGLIPCEYFLVFFLSLPSYSKGEVAEWLNAHAWKACLRKRNGGSNPPLSAFKKSPLRAFFIYWY